MLNDILKENGFQIRISEDERRNYPAKVFFLEESFLRHYYPIAELPPAHLGDLLAAAARIAADPGKREAAWCLYRIFLGDDTETIRSFPERMTVPGDDTPLLYLLLLMALIPAYEERAEREGFPLRYAHAAATRIGNAAKLYAKGHGGGFGAMPISLPFMLHFLYRPAYRIGRFDFMLEQAGRNLPLIFERKGEFRLFCRDGWELNADGERAAPGEKVLRTAFFREEGDSAEGIPIDPATGLAEQRYARIPLRDHTKPVEPGDWVLHFHIPGGGGMKPELCTASFREAFRFFREHFPDRPIRLIYTVSWIGNPLWAERMPDSNLAALIRTSLLFPGLSSPDAGVFFVFGRNDRPYENYPCGTTLERIILDHLRDGGRLRAVGMLIPPALYETDRT